MAGVGNSGGPSIEPSLCGATGLLLAANDAPFLRPLQADQLSAASCLELLNHLETGVSEHDQLQAMGGSLQVAACQRLSKLLAEDPAVCSDAAVQAQLLAFLGPLHNMLNDSRRPELFLGLPFKALQASIW